MSDDAKSAAPKVAARNAALLLLVGLLTGGYVSAAMTGKISADPHMALAAHLNCLLGAFWLLGMGWSLPMLRYGESADKKKRCQKTHARLCFRAKRLVLRWRCMRSRRKSKSANSSGRPVPRR